MNHGVYLGIPTHNGALDYRAETAIGHFRRSFPVHLVRVNVVSLLCLSFNTLYAHALNMRREGVTHFLLLHDDVVPIGEDWARTLVSVVDKGGFGVVSGIIPIKSESVRETSTAIDRGKGPERVPTPAGPTLLESDKVDGVLLVNTGLMLVDIRQPWAERLWFWTKDGIRRENGEFVATCEPEDWVCSRWLHKQGVRYAATNAVKVLHVGRKAWRSHGDDLSA